MDSNFKATSTPLCGYQWVQEHAHDLDGWQPTFELITDGYTQKIHGQLDKVIEAVRINLK